MDVVLILSVALAASLAANVTLAGMLAGMVPKDIAIELARAVPPEMAKERSHALRDYMLKNEAKWDDIIGHLAVTATESVLEVIEETDVDETL